VQYSDALSVLRGTQGKWRALRLAQDPLTVDILTQKHHYVTRGPLVLLLAKE